MYFTTKGLPQRFKEGVDVKRLSFNHIIVNNLTPFQPKNHRSATEIPPPPPGIIKGRTN
jgi:hypothetical protein